MSKSFLKTLQLRDWESGYCVWVWVSGGKLSHACAQQHDDQQCLIFAILYSLFPLFFLRTFGGFSKGLDIHSKENFTKRWSVSQNASDLIMKAFLVMWKQQIILRKSTQYFMEKNTVRFKIYIMKSNVFCIFSIVWHSSPWDTLAPVPF